MFETTEAPLNTGYTRQLPVASTCRIHRVVCRCIYLYIMEFVAQYFNTIKKLQLLICPLENEEHSLSLKASADCDANGELSMGRLIWFVGVLYSVLLNRYYFA